jgi:hypothetical protein
MHYRCYLFNAHDNIVSADTVTSETPEGALNLAREKLRKLWREAHAVEIWDRATLVGRIQNDIPPALGIASLLVTKSAK